MEDLILFISLEFKSGNALLILLFIISFDLKAGPIIWNNLPPRKEENLTPKILKIKNKKTIIIN
jgi:hypothetical protein